MALRLFTCSKCGSSRKTFKAKPLCCDVEMSSVMVAPEAKFTEARNADDTSKQVLKGQNKILKKRAKDYMRDVEMHDMIQSNSPEIARQMGWLNEKGLKRSKIDEM